MTVGPTSETPDLGRRERRKLEVRNRILEAGSQLFESQGIDATRVQEVCALADVAHKTFFNHFPSKRHLLREIAQAGVDQLLLDIEEVRNASGYRGGPQGAGLESRADSPLLREDRRQCRRGRSDAARAADRDGACQSRVRCGERAGEAAPRCIRCARARGSWRRRPDDAARTRHADRHADGCVLRIDVQLGQFGRLPDARARARHDELPGGLDVAR
ncbi:MAG: helix-turn-helix transcriptional regulator [Deltaproteobacteria bacterium]|nr:helix-turn-helix transcriptional regulator [Deltaproteobacteria bacterium]